MAEHWTGEPVLGELDKHDAIGWFALDDLPKSIIAYTSQGLRFGIEGRTFSTFDWLGTDNQSAIPDVSEAGLT